MLQYTNGHRVYFNIQTAAECTSIYKRPQSVLQYKNGDRLYFNIQTATERTSIYKLTQSEVQYKNGHRFYFNLKTATECTYYTTATECTSIYKRPQSVLQYTNGHRVYFNIQTATECSTRKAQRQKEGGRTAPDAGRSQTNELSAPSLTEQRAKPSRGGSSLSPVSACYCKFRHRALDRCRHRFKNIGLNRQYAEATSMLSHWKLHPRSNAISYIHSETPQATSMLKTPEVTVTLKHHKLHPH